MFRLPSPLDPGTEAVVMQTIGCCIEVHRELGPGLLEKIYARAALLELESKGLTVTRELRVPVVYRGQLLCHQRIDLVVDNQVVLELKSVERLMPIHQAQLLNYLRLTRLRVGLLVNFNVALLPHGLRRVVL